MEKKKNKKIKSKTKELLDDIKDIFIEKEEKFTTVDEIENQLIKCKELLDFILTNEHLRYSKDVETKYNQIFKRS